MFEKNKSFKLIINRIKYSNGLKSLINSKLMNNLI